MRAIWKSLPLELLLGSGGTIALIAAMLAVGFVWSFVARRRLANDPETKMALDRQLDPRRSWVQGASFILMRLHDNAYLSRDLISDMLAQSWGISSRAELDATVARLVREEKDAWGLLRALLLLRSAVAVGWLTNEASFERCFEVGGELQSRYTGWEDLAQDILRRRRAWWDLPEDGSADDEDMKEVVAVVDYLRDTQWKQTPWTARLDRP